jgi:hypothetical protein
MLEHQARDTTESGLCEVLAEAEETMELLVYNKIR